MSSLTSQIKETLSVLSEINEKVKIRFELLNPYKDFISVFEIEDSTLKVLIENDETYGDDYIIADFPLEYLELSDEKFTDMLNEKKRKEKEYQRKRDLEQLKRLQEKYNV